MVTEFIAGAAMGNRRHAVFGGTSNQAGPASGAAAFWMIAARCGRTLQGASSVPEFPAGAPPNLESVGRAAGVTLW